MKQLSKKYKVKYYDHNNMHDHKALYNSDFIHRSEMNKDEKDKFNRGESLLESKFGKKIPKYFM